MTANTNIESILHEVYEVGPVVCDPVTVIWAADRIEDTARAKRELKRINAIRARHGKIPACVPYGHRLF